MEEGSKMEPTHNNPGALAEFDFASPAVKPNVELGREICASSKWPSSENGLGTLSEIFDGDAPHTPRGCIAQAWTAAEVLRAWRATIV